MSDVCVASVRCWMPVRCVRYVDGCGVLEVSDVCVASALRWMPVRSGACGKKYSAGGVCML